MNGRLTRTAPVLWQRRDQRSDVIWRRRHQTSFTIRGRGRGALSRRVSTETRSAEGLERPDRTVRTVFRDRRRPCYEFPPGPSRARVSAPRSVSSSAWMPTLPFPVWRSRCAIQDSSAPPCASLGCRPSRWNYPTGTQASGQPLTVPDAGSASRIAPGLHYLQYALGYEVRNLRIISDCR